MEPKKTLFIIALAALVLLSGCFEETYCEPAWELYDACIYDLQECKYDAAGQMTIEEAIAKDEKKQFCECWSDEPCAEELEEKSEKGYEIIWDYVRPAEFPTKPFDENCLKPVPEYKDCDCIPNTCDCNCGGILEPTSCAE